jgi:hypothetical protein
MENWEDDPSIERIFASEMQALKDSDALILLEPTGHSSLTEAGIAYGMGNRVLLISLVERPEVIYRICGSRYPDIETFLSDLNSLTGR